jgi:hypothetical protein
MNWVSYALVIKMCPKLVNFCVAPSVLQTAVNKNSWNSESDITIEPWSIVNIYCLLYSNLCYYINHYWKLLSNSDVMYVKNLKFLFGTCLSCYRKNCLPYCCLQNRWQCHFWQAHTHHFMHKICKAYNSWTSCWFCSVYTWILLASTSSIDLSKQIHKKCAPNCSL